MHNYGKISVREYALSPHSTTTLEFALQKSCNHKVNIILDVVNNINRSLNVYIRILQVLCQYLRANLCTCHMYTILAYMRPI